MKFETHYTHGKHILVLRSNKELTKLGLAKVEKDLRNNGYPRKLINKCEKNITKPIFKSDISSNQKVIVKVPYLTGVTERVSKL